MLAHAVGRGPQRRRGGRGHRQHQRPVGAARHRPVRRCLGVLAEHDVRVGTGEAERADPGGPEPAVAGPRDGVGGQPQRHPVPPDPAGRVVGVQVPGQLAVPQREHDLEQAGHPGRRLQVPDVGLHRAHQQRIRVVPAGTEGGGQRAEFDRVAQRRAGAVRLDVVDLRRPNPGPPERRPHHLSLRLAAGNGEAAAGAVGVHRAAADQRVDPVAVGTGSGQRLEHHDADPLAAPVPVRLLGEGLAAPVRRQRAAGGHREVDRRRDDHVDAAGDGDLALPGPQALAREVDRGQGGRARRVDGEARSTHPEEVRQPAGSAAERRAGAVVEVHVLWPPGEQLLVVGGVQTHENPGPAVGQPVQDQPGVVDRLPRRLQEQPLLRVHAAGLGG